jgi:hypothetical protein
LPVVVGIVVCGVMANVFSEMQYEYGVLSTISWKLDSRTIPGRRAALKGSSGTGSLDPLQMLPITV